jgi:hypothetical protein
MAAIACSAGLKAALARLEWSSPIWAIFPLAERRIVLEKKIQINRVPPPLLRSEIAQLEALYDSSATLKPGARTGLRTTLRFRGSGGVVERFCNARLEWLRGRERRLLGERRKLLGLLGQRLELFACMFGPKF